MRKTDAFRRAAALMAALSITVSLAAPAFAGTYYIDDGDITITKDENGQTVKQGNKEAENIGADEEIIITTHKEATTTLESDLEGPAAEDTGFGPVVEDNYQPAQPESAAGIDWYFNEVEELQTSIACGAEAAKTVSLTEEQLQNYYGIKVIPDAIPDGYVQTDEEKTYQIGYDADGNVIDDNCVMRYENSETAGWFTIRARSTDMGEMTSYVSGGLKPMTVSGVKVTAAHYPAGSSGGTFTDGYLATYKKNGVTVNVQSEGLSRDEFCALVENLLAE